MALTDIEMAKAAPFLDRFNNLCLIEGKYNGGKRAFIARINEDPRSREVIIEPLFMVLDAADMDRIVDGDGKPLSPEGEPEKAGEDALARRRVSAAMDAAGVKSLPLDAAAKMLPVRAEWASFGRRSKT